MHRYDKLFYENEVVKSGQYRDHLIDEVIEKCFVLFFTKYQRGRPVNLGDRAVYCCESRYNETEKTFNKIRTWKACIPDEVRSVEYEMDLFDRVRPLRRVVSPIKHLLPEDAKDDDPIPEAKLGVDNAPPIIGAVYKRPPDPNEKEMTPTPDASATRTGGSANSPRPRNTSLSQNANDRTFRNRMLADGAMSRGRLPSYNENVSRMSGLSNRTSGIPGGYSGYSDRQNSPGSYMGPGGMGSSALFNSKVGPAYNPPPPPSTFTLPEYITDQIPKETLELYKRDMNGKMLWFSVPPVDSMSVIGSSDTPGRGILGNSVEYLSRRQEILEKRKLRESQREAYFCKKPCF